MVHQYLTSEFPTHENREFLPHNRELNRAIREMFLLIREPQNRAFWMFALAAKSDPNRGDTHAKRSSPAAFSSLFGSSENLGKRAGMSASEQSVGNRRRRADRTAFAHPVVAALTGRDPAWLAAEDLKSISGEPHPAETGSWFEERPARKADLHRVSHEVRNHGTAMVPIKGKKRGCCAVRARARGAAARAQPSLRESPACRRNRSACPRSETRGTAGPHRSI